MKTTVVSVLSGAALALLVAGSACQSSSSSPSDSTGAGAGTGAGTGGTSANGGSGATGGTSSSAGTSSTTGGSTAAGGGAATGGMAGTGGSSGPGTGGSGGSGAGGDPMGGNAGAAGAGNCSKVGTLHPPSPDAGAATVYCPFATGSGGAGGSASTSVYCQAQVEHCCEGGVGETTMCLPLATKCPQMKPTDWVCEDPGDCPSGQVCCSNTGSSIVLGTPQGGMACGNYVKAMTGTLCAKSCDPTSIQMCTSDTECGAGKTCIPFGKSGNQVGGCSK